MLSNILRSSSSTWFRGVVNNCFEAPRLLFSTNVTEFDTNKEVALIAKEKPQPKEFWKIRDSLSKPKIQRYEKPIHKNFYAPEWKIEQTERNREYDPLLKYGTTPEKWEYYNKVVWPKNYVVPETGLPKPREIFHCRESIHHHPKKMSSACRFARRMGVNEAITQLRSNQRKGALILAEVIEEAMQRAKKEFHIENTENMFLAEAFCIQDKIIKGRKRHARQRWTITRYRYVNLFVRLEEGAPPPHNKRAGEPDGWEQMQSYYTYLRNRDFKYSL